MKLYLQIITIIFSQFSFAQQTESNFVGGLIIDSTTFISYNLYFTIHDDKISGHSISDFNGPDETKSTISGTIDNDKLEIKELDIVYTKSNIEENDFCFLKFNLELINNEQALSGNFFGTYNDSTVCASGRLEMVDSLSLNKIKKKVNRVKEKPQPKKIKTITEEKNLSFSTKLDELQLNIWDQGKIDNDIVSIYHNDTLLLNNYTLTREPILLDVKLKEGKNVFRLVAINEGSLPPNTARLKLLGGGKTHEVASLLKEGRQSKIVIRKK